MYQIDACPCCESQELQRWPAIVSPFITTYACGSKPQLCGLCECRSCTFRFFDSRLTDEEIAKLYAGYRGDEYYKARHACEPWYTRAANDGIGGDTHEIASRKQNLIAVLGDHAKSITTVLDYGGDRGQMIPDTLGRERFVYEISDAPTVDGVQRITQLNGRKFDFVMLAHVLEHCSEPKDMLNTLKPLLHERSLLYLEVPFERPTMSLAGTGSLQRNYLEHAARHGATVEDGRLLLHRRTSQIQHHPAPRVAEMQRTPQLLHPRVSQSAPRTERPRTDQIRYRCLRIERPRATSSLRIGAASRKLSIALLRRTTRPRNQSIHPQILHHLSIMIEAMPHGKRNQRPARLQPRLLRLDHLESIRHRQRPNRLMHR